jgi:hypothetical protein
MSNPTYFVQPCPTCGRRLNIRVEHLGKRMVCQHCRGVLTARDPASTGGAAAEAENDLLRRADMLLQSLQPPHTQRQTPLPR